MLNKQVTKVRQRCCMQMIHPGAINCLWWEWSYWLTNIRMYESISWYVRNGVAVNLRCAWGWKMYVMKNLAVLQALASAQAYRIHLRADEKMGISERGKVRTSKKVFAHWRRWGKQQQCNNLFCLTESGGVTSEAVIISRGGIAASPLQIEYQVKVHLKGSSMTKKSEIRRKSSWLWQ